MNAFRNAFRVVANRFAFLWTHIAYYSLAAFLIISLGISIFVPYINKIVENFNMFGRISEIGQAIVDNQGLEQFLNLGKQFFIDLSSIFTSGNGFSTILLIFLLLIVSRFVLGLADLAFYNVIDMHLGSAAKQSFRVSFIKTLGKAAVYQLCKMLFTLPFDVFIFALIYLITFAFSGPAFFLTPFLMLFVFVLSYSLKLALFSGWAPEILHSENKKIFTAFFKSVGLLKRNFARNYSSMILYIIVAIALNVFFGIFTLGVGLFITAPLSIYLLTVLNSTLYYQNNNLRYYIDKNTIIN